VFGNRRLDHLRSYRTWKYECDGNTSNANRIVVWKSFG